MSHLMNRGWSGACPRAERTATERGAKVIITSNFEAEHVLSNMGGHEFTYMIKLDS